MKRKKDPTSALGFKKTRVFSTRDQPHSGSGFGGSVKVQRVREHIKGKHTLGSWEKTEKQKGNYAF